MSALHDRISARYELCTHRLGAGGRSFSVVAVRDTNVLLDRITPEQYREDERLPFWADLWPSGIALAEWFGSARIGPRNRILELGCGVGLAGIVAASLGAEVTMTDFEEDALLFARYNALTNLAAESARSIRFESLDWRSPLVGGQWDLVCGADILYDRAVLEPLRVLLGKVVAPAGCAVLADPHRSAADDFLAGAAGGGFDVQLHETTVMHGGRGTRVRLCILRRTP